MTKLLLTIAWASFLAQGQLAAQALTFEVSSVKPNHSLDRMAFNPGVNNGGRFIVDNMPLNMLIELAYGNGIHEARLSGAPSWIATERFDIEAKAPEGLNPGPEQAMEMLRSLLVERFALRAHNESQEGPIYALVVAKNGLKAKLSASQVRFNPASAPPAAGGGSGPAAPLAHGMVALSPGLIRVAGRPINVLIPPLMIEVGRLVVDRTGLDSLYDFDLKWAPGRTRTNTAPDPDAEVDRASIFTALQEQLGLRLEATKGPIESLVIDSIDRPTEN